MEVPRAQPANLTGGRVPFERNLVALAPPSNIGGLGLVEAWSFGADHVSILMREPVLCAGCAAMHFWFINRAGRTRCFECDMRTKENPVGSHGA